MSYSLFLDGVQFPIAPSSMETKIKNNNKTTTLINESEVNILKKPGLTDIPFELLLPNSKYPFAVYPDGFQPATYYLDILESLKVSNKPFQFIFSRMKPNGDLLFDTNMKVSLEDYSIDEDAENGFDIVVSLNLKQYREYGTKVLELKKSKVSGGKPITKTTKPRASSKVVPKSHKVIRGDTLWAISKKYYGKVTKAMTDELAAKNGIKNPDLIYPGDVIKL